MKYYVYMLENDSRRHYIGITTEPDRRLIEHNGGSTRSTRPFRPWKLIYTEEFGSRAEACRREWYLKHAEGRKEKLEIIKKYGKLHHTNGVEMLRYPQKSHRKNIVIPQESDKLAELMGAVFGDGGINNDWQLVISLNSEKDKDYSVYLGNLLKNLFGIEVAVRKRPNQNTLTLTCSSMNMVEFLIRKGAVKGNKIAQNIDIPEWISNNCKLEKSFIRGIVDTDGGLYIHKHIVSGKTYNNIGLCFTSYSKKLLNSVSKIFAKNGVVPHFGNNKKNIYLYSYKAVEKYLEVFRSNNPRITKKYNQWRDAGVV